MTQSVLRASIGTMLIMGLALLAGCGTSTAQGAVSASSSGSPSSAKQAKVGTKENPVPFGQALAYTDKGRRFEVSVVSAQRDDGTLLKQTNMFNSEAEAGNEFILVKMNLKYVEGSEAYKTSSSGASVLYQGRMWGSKGLNVVPEPKFGSIEVYSGGEVEGWIEPLQVPASASPLTLNWGQSLIGGGGYWFELPPDL